MTSKMFSRAGLVALAGAILLAIVLSLPAFDASYAQTSATPAAPAADYSDTSVWLCRPGRQDACAASQDATIVAVDGSLTRETFHPAKNPPIDCFYV